MRIAESVEWAAHCAVVLAGLPEGATMPGGALAEFHAVPAPYLAKSLQALARAGVIESVAGRRGGYRLARAAQEITLLDIVLAVDGDQQAFRCTEIRQQGPCAVESSSYRGRCAIAAAMWRAEKAYRDSLSTVTIGDIAERVLATAPAEGLRLASAWLPGVVRLPGEQ
jgi:Rrf2 family protein